MENLFATGFRRLVIWSIIGIGISSVTTQILTLREFLTQFHGNEITISLVIFCWLMVTGMGSFAGKFSRKASTRIYLFLILIIAVWPLFQIVAIRIFRELYFTHGVSPGFYEILFYIAITISPYCLLTGFILPYSQTLLHSFHIPFESGQLFITDSIGDIVGGVLFSFLLVYWFKPFTVIAITSALLILVVLFLGLRLKKWIFTATAVFLTAVFYVFALNPSIETRTLEGQYGKIADYLESQFGRIVISKEGTQYTFWESGLPLYSDSNIIDAEEKVHYPLSQLNEPGILLLVSGGFGETLKEIGKYKPARVDYVELDPALTHAALGLGILKPAPFVHIINTDARRYMKSTRRLYDAVILDLPEPDTFQINRFFTDEFFSLAKGILKEKGILSLNMDYSPNYLSDLRKKKLSTLYHTAKMHFKNILVLPGEQAWFLLSDGALDTHIPERLRLKGISTAYIDGFFHGNITDERIRNLKDRLDRDETINTDFAPKLMHIVFKEWFTKHEITPIYFIYVLGGLTLLYFIFLKKEEYVLFSTGFAAMGLEIIIVFAFQIIYGYIYKEIGAIITAFLLGLLPGAMIGRKWRKKNSVKMGVSEATILCLLVIFFCWTGWFKLALHPLFFLLFCFVFSFFCGFQFPVATEMLGEHQSPAAGCLAADLCGAAMGALVVGALLIPLWGTGIAVLLLILVKLTSITLLTKRRTKAHSERQTDLNERGENHG